MLNEKPILFNSAMIRSILKNRKSQTRRVIKPQPPSYNWHPKEHSAQPCYWIGYSDTGKLRNDVGGLKNDCGWKCPFGAPGDRLWVRETWRETWSSSHNPMDKPSKHETGVEYRATWNGRRDPEARIIVTNGPRYGGDMAKDGHVKWRPSIYMPRWASRITLEVVGVKVERVQEINGTDAQAEGWPRDQELFPTVNAGYKANFWFSNLWDSINAKRGYGWSVNPWCWCVEFKQLATTERKT